MTLIMAQASDVMSSLVHQTSSSTSAPTVLLGVMAPPMLQPLKLVTMIVTLLPKSVTPRQNNHCPDSVIVILSSSALRRHGAGTFCVWATFVHKTADRFLTDKNQCPESGQWFGGCRRDSRHCPVLAGNPPELAVVFLCYNLLIRFRSKSQ